MLDDNDGGDDDDDDNDDNSYTQSQDTHTEYPKSECNFIFVDASVAMTFLFLSFLFQKLKRI